MSGRGFKPRPLGFEESRLRSLHTRLLLGLLRLGLLRLLADLLLQLLGLLEVLLKVLQALIEMLLKLRLLDLLANLLKVLDRLLMSLHHDADVLLVELLTLGLLKLLGLLLEALGELLLELLGLLGADHVDIGLVGSLHELALGVTLLVKKVRGQLAKLLILGLVHAEQRELGDRLAHRIRPGIHLLLALLHLLTHLRLLGARLLGMGLLARPLLRRLGARLLLLARLSLTHRNAAQPENQRERS
jgi:hypothetical protein